ncbi:DNA pilot protein [Microviridae sp.]|nr:DNA pilot protein [Microviridae sp.]
MDFGSVSGLGGAVLGFLGQQQTNQKNWDITQSANAASAAQAQAQMDFQERMRQTQYQTAIEDMKKAGLNPMLAYSQGGAGVPTGAMGSVSTAKMENALGAGVSGYQALATNNADLDLKASQTSATTAQAIKTEADTIQTKAMTLKTAEDTALSTQQKVNLQEQIRKLDEEIANLRATRMLTGAQTQNVKENIAPSTDPYWYRDLKRVVSSAKDVATQKRIPLFNKEGAEETFNKLRQKLSK